MNETGEPASDEMISLQSPSFDDLLDKAMAQILTKGYVVLKNRDEEIIIDYRDR